MGGPQPAERLFPTINPPDRHDPELEPFWDGTEKDELRVQRCVACGTVRWPPRPACAKCGSLDTEWVQVRGQGELFSWTVVGRATLPDFVDQVPYAVAVVEIENAPVRFIGKVDTDDPWGLEVGMAVTAVFQDHAAGVRLAVWRPVTATRLLPAPAQSGPPWRK